VTLPLEPQLIIGELMRIYSGRISLYAHFGAIDCLTANGYAKPFGYKDATLTPKGKALAEKIIHASGLRVIMQEF